MFKEWDGMSYYIKFTEMLYMNAIVIAESKYLLTKST